MNRLKIICDALDDSNTPPKKKSKLEKAKLGGDGNTSMSIPKRIPDIQTEHILEKRKKKRKLRKDDKMVKLTDDEKRNVRNVLEPSDDQFNERVRKLTTKLGLPHEAEQYVRSLRLKKLKDISFWTSQYPSMSPDVRRRMVKQRIACFMLNRTFNGELFLRPHISKDLSVPRVAGGSLAKPENANQATSLEHDSILKEIRRKLNCSRKGIGKAQAMFLESMTIVVNMLADLMNGDDMTKLQQASVKNGLVELETVVDLLLLATGDMRYCIHVANLPKFTRRSKLMLALSGKGHQPTNIWFQGSHQAYVEYDNPAGYKFGLRRNGKLFEDRTLVVTRQ